MIYMPKHFKLMEIFPKYIVHSINPNRLWGTMDAKLLMSIDNVREYFNRPIHINYAGMECRGFRDCDKCGDVGAKLSMHRLGGALDFDVEGLTADEVRQVLIEKQHLWTGIRRIEMNVGWVHIDSLETNNNHITLFRG